MASLEPRFPVLIQGSREKCVALRAAGCPETVPWDLLAPHEKQALRNHDQTLKRLAERGGLSPAEMVAVIEGSSIPFGKRDVDMLPRLLELIREYESKETRT